MADYAFSHFKIDFFLPGFLNGEEQKIKVNNTEVLYSV